MTTYKATPLDFSKAEIRSLTLHPAKSTSDPICISLKNVALPPSSLLGQTTYLEEEEEAVSEQPEPEAPNYLTLSYVWGSPSDPKLVHVASAPEGANLISITNNLDVALRSLRLKNKPLVIWIDAICIDQGNAEERSQQVALMDSIYWNATGAVVWLGPEADNSNTAIDLLRDLGTVVVRNEDGTLERNPDAPSPGPGEPNWDSLSEELPYDEEQLRSIISIFERPWFGRLWIRQEIALSDQAIFVCGQAKIDWATFKNAGVCFFFKHFPAALRDNPLHERFSRAKLAVINILEITDMTYYYETLRNDHEGVKFTDPRDTIYAVKSLLAAPDAALGVRPNYNLPVADVFMDVCVRIVEQQSLMSFLRSCEALSAAVPNLPSWVPDWSTPMTAEQRFIDSWSACGFISAQASYLGGRTVRAAGVQVAKVARLRQIYRNPGAGLVRNPKTLVDRIRDCYPGDAFVDEPYLGRESMADAVCRTFYCDRFQESVVPSKMSRLTFEDAKKAVLKIWSKEEDWNDYERFKNDSNMEVFFDNCIPYCCGRCFFVTEDGHMGLAPQATRVGDVVCVILGSDSPVVLRGDPTGRWKVVGACYAHGLMCGEAIYGSHLPEYYRPVQYINVPSDERINDKGCALRDTRTGELRTDPAEILTEMGIRPSVWVRDPYQLEVPADTLRAAGVELQDFDLV